MVAVEHAPPNVVKLGSASHRVQPAVVEHDLMTGAEFLLVGPEPEITQLHHTRATMCWRAV